jgi:hypothetical protein
MPYAKSDDGNIIGVWHNNYEGFVLKECRILSKNVELVIANYERGTLTHYAFDKDGKYDKLGMYTQGLLTCI